jgi:uncharacterized protein (DUF433 family)
MVAVNPNSLLRRAETTTKRARTSLEQNPSDETAMVAMADGVRAMWQAMNAVLLAVGIPPDADQLMARISQDIISKGILSIETYRLLQDAEAVKTRAVYGADNADAQHAMMLLKWANKFIELTRKAIVERTAPQEIIRKTPDIVGGNACVRGTRIPVWTLVQLKKLGRTDQELLTDFPGLTESDLEAAWVYYQGNTAEIEEAIQAEAGED